MSNLQTMNAAVAAAASIGGYMLVGSANAVVFDTSGEDATFEVKYEPGEAPEWLNDGINAAAATGLTVMDIREAPEQERKAFLMTIQVVGLPDPGNPQNIADLAEVAKLAGGTVHNATPSN